jgi:ribosomal-protein-alanine N-acetyltransferase
MTEQTSIPALTAAPRLNLIPTTPDHFPGLHAIFSDDETMRFMPTLPHKTVEETKKHIEHDMSHPGAQHWTIFLKNSDEPIGLVNRLGGTMIPGMGYIIKRNYWGQGLAAEACRQVMAYQFEQEDIDKLELWINEDNRASLRVAEKLGFKLKGQLLQKYDYEDNHHVMLVYGLWKEEWSGGAHLLTKARISDVDPVLIVNDIESALKFFTETLGFDLNFTWGNPINHAGVTWGDWSGAQVLIQLGQAPPDFDKTPYTQLHFSTDAKLDELFNTFKANGVEVVTEPTDHPWGMRDFSIRGPEGSLLRFGTHI